MSNLMYGSEMLASAIPQAIPPESQTILETVAKGGEADNEGQHILSFAIADAGDCSRGDLTPVTNCCLKKRCYENVLPKTQNDLFNCFWRIGDYAKQNYFLVGLMAAQTPKQVTSRPLKKNKSLSWKYWVDIRGRKVQVCKGFFLAVYGVSDKRLRVLQTKLVNGEPLEDQRGKYDNSRRANQHTARRKLDGPQTPPSDHISVLPKSAKKSKVDPIDVTSSIVINNDIIVNEIITSSFQPN